VPRSFTISSNEILEALTDPLNQIVSSVKNALEQTPPELGADIAERGMMLTGGGALLRDLDRLLAEETGLPVLSPKIRSPASSAAAAWRSSGWSARLDLHVRVNGAPGVRSVVASGGAPVARAALRRAAR
jgi:hypothetical protein